MIDMNFSFISEDKYEFAMTQNSIFYLIGLCLPAVPNTNSHIILWIYKPNEQHILTWENYYFWTTHRPARKKTNASFCSKMVIFKSWFYILLVDVKWCTCFAVLILNSTSSLFNSGEVMNLTCVNHLPLWEQILCGDSSLKIPPIPLC